MKTLFHGTTLENYESILKNGFSPRTDKTWECSDDRTIYFYDMDKDVNGCEDETEQREDCIRRCFENSQISASIQNFTGSKLVVFEIEIASEYCEDDYSCDNMSDAATCVDIDYLDVSMIKNVYVSEAYNPSLRMFYISPLYNNEQLNKEVFNDLELQAFEIIANAQCYIEDLMYFDWEQLQ